MFGRIEQMMRILQSGEEWLQPMIGFGGRGPKAEVSELADQVKVVLEAPGLTSGKKRPRWAIRVSGKNLFLRGQMDTENSVRSNSGTFYNERNSEQFTKIIPLPSHVKRTPSMVRYEDGLITIVLDKQPTPLEEEWHVLEFDKK